MDEGILLLGVVGRQVEICAARLSFTPHSKGEKKINLYGVCMYVCMYCMYVHMRLAGGI